MDTWIDGREAGTSQSHSRHEKGHITNIYLMEAIVDFAKDKSKEGVSLGEVRQQLQPVCQGVQEMV